MKCSFILILIFLMSMISFAEGDLIEDKSRLENIYLDIGDLNHEIAKLRINITSIEGSNLNSTITVQEIDEEKQASIALEHKIADIGDFTGNRLLCISFSLLAFLVGIGAYFFLNRIMRSVKR